MNNSHDNMAYKGSVAGLKGLFSNVSNQVASQVNSVASKIDRKIEQIAGSNVGTSKIEISHIYPCADQPRQVFEPKALEELAQTMRELGQAQAITVRKTEQGYEIISGERRYRAAKLAGFTQLDCIVKNCTPQEARLLALVENMQREDLLPIEEAHYLKKILAENNELTLEKLAKMLGSHKSTLSEKIQLTEVPDDFQKLLHSRGRTFTHRHWRVISRAQDIELKHNLLKQALEEQLSVAELEQAVNGAGIPKGRRVSQRKARASESLAEQLSLDFRLLKKDGDSIKIQPVSFAASSLTPELKQHLALELEGALKEIRS